MEWLTGSWLWGILINALKYLYNLFVSLASIKFVVAAALAYIVATLTAFIEQLADFASFSSIGDMFGALPDALLYFIGVLEIDTGIPLLLGAWLIRFTIRRLPVVG